jgi:ATP-binding cassette subfamily F protein 3
VLEVGQGHAIRYLGNYDQYLEKKSVLEAAANSKTGGPAVNGTPPAASNGRSPEERRKDNHARKQEREAARGRERTAQTRERIEAEIARREDERAHLASEMNDPNFYLARADADKMITRYQQIDREIEKLYADLLGLDEVQRAAR